jgi:hypothetical protein
MYRFGAPSENWAATGAQPMPRHAGQRGGRKLRRGRTGCNAGSRARIADSSDGPVGCGPSECIRLSECAAGAIRESSRCGVADRAEMEALAVSVEGLTEMLLSAGRPAPQGSGYKLSPNSFRYLHRWQRRRIETWKNCEKHSPTRELFHCVWYRTMLLSRSLLRISPSHPATHLGDGLLRNR